MARIIHVALGGSAAGTLSEALSTDDVIGVDDLLSCGPVPAIHEVAAWRARRAAFWKLTLKAQGIEAEQLDGCSYIVDKHDCLSAAAEIVVWLGTSLDDQLMLAWMPQLLRGLDIDLHKLRIVQFDRDPSGYPNLKLGCKHAHEFLSAPAARALSQAELAYLDQAWAAFAAPDPEPLLRLLDHPGMPLPLIPEAMRLLLRRYPDFRSGVNRHESLLLAKTREHGPAAARVIGETMRASWHDHDPEGDVSLFARLQRLADTTLPHPAVLLSGPCATMRGTEVRLTPVGEQILNDEANFVALNGIDDWIGGVHLDSNVGNVWFHHEGTLVRAEA